MREFVEAVKVLGLWRTTWLTFAYRPVCRLMHRFHLHYAPPVCNGEVLWCQWCGLRYAVPKLMGMEPIRTAVNGEGGL